MEDLKKLKGTFSPAEGEMLVEMLLNKIESSKKFSDAYYSINDLKNADKFEKQMKMAASIYKTISQMYHKTPTAKAD